MDTRISYSEIYAFLRCQKFHQYKYLKRLEPTSGREDLMLGSIIHKGFQTLLTRGITGLGKLEEFIDFPVEEFGVDLSEVKQIVKRAVEDTWSAGFIRYVPSYVEREVSVEFKSLQTGSIVKVYGIIDGILIDDNGDWWLSDWKVRKRSFTDNREEYNLQNYLNAKALLDLGIKIAGFMTIQVRSTLPKWPKQNKDGSVSRSAIATDWRTYKEAIEYYGENPDDYDDMRIKLESYEFVRINKEYITERTLENVWDEVIRPVATQIHLLTHGPSAPCWYSNLYKPVRSLGPFVCGLCDYKAICFGDLREDDTSSLIGTMYLRRGTSNKDHSINIDFGEVQDALYSNR